MANESLDKAHELAQVVLVIVRDRLGRMPTATMELSPEAEAVLLEVMAESFEMVGDTLISGLKQAVRDAAIQRVANRDN